MNEPNHSPDETIELTIRLKRSVVDWLERANAEFGLRNTAEVASRVLEELIGDASQDDQRRDSQASPSPSPSR